MAKSFAFNQDLDGTESFGQQALDTWSSRLTYAAILDVRRPWVQAGIALSLLALAVAVAGAVAALVQ